MKKHALLVGVDRYEDPQIHSLQCAENDCIELAGFLKHRARYDRVEHLRGPSSEEMLDTASQLARELGPGGLFLFFFAGHGVQHEKRHLLLCPRVRLNWLKSSFPQQVVSVDLLETETDWAGLERLFILDACRSDLSPTRRAEGEGFRGEECMRDVVGKSCLGGAQSLAILCSCAKGRQAGEIVAKRQGLFTQALLDVLQEAVETGTEVKLSDALERELAERMRRLAQESGLLANQQPLIQRSGPPPVLLSGRKEPPQEAKSQAEATAQQAQREAEAAARAGAEQEAKGKAEARASAEAEAKAKAEAEVWTAQEARKRALAEAKGKIVIFQYPTRARQQAEAWGEREDPDEWEERDR